MHTLFFIAAMLATIPTLMQVAQLLLQKHFGNWNDQIRLRDHGIWCCVHKYPPMIATLYLLLGLALFVMGV